jgi:hypothetical protein
MSDMVKRLRHRARFDTCEPPEKLMQEAAGEIERLRARIADAETSLRIWDHGNSSEYWVRWPALNGQLGNKEDGG